jgi:GNAT superfamily N-acetyltransferase
MEREDAVLFVAESAGEIVGLAEIYLRQDDVHEVTMAYRYGYLQSLMVSEAHRGQGIGIALVTAVETWAAAQGATEMRLETWEFAAGPLPFYERAGYTTLRRTLVRSLES